MSVLASIDQKQFEPVPSVGVVLVGFEKRDDPVINFEYRQIYRDFVIYGYNQWQPTLLDAFKEVFSNKQLGIVSRNLGISGKKPSEVTVQDWVKMFNTFIKFVPDDKKNIVLGAEKRLRLLQKGIEKRHRTGAK